MLLICCKGRKESIGRQIKVEFKREIKGKMKPFLFLIV